MTNEKASAAHVEIRSEARGPHWIAWLAGDGGKPANAVVIVGETREEAEERAREYAAGIAARGGA